MPALGAVDPADLRAQAHAELGLSRKLAQPRHVEPHPRRGGSSGYPDVGPLINLGTQHDGRSARAWMKRI